jgi:hypothetical protein
MKTGQTAARLLGCHLIGDFRSDLPKTTLSIEPVRCSLNLSRAQNHLCKSERTRFRLRTIEHALRNA